MPAAPFRIENDVPVDAVGREVSRPPVLPRTIVLAAAWKAPVADMRSAREPQRPPPVNPDWRRSPGERIVAIGTGSGTNTGYDSPLATAHFAKPRRRQPRRPVKTHPFVQAHIPAGRIVFSRLNDLVAKSRFACFQRQSGVIFARSISNGDHADSRTRRSVDAARIAVPDGLFPWSLLWMQSLPRQPGSRQ